PAAPPPAPFAPTTWPGARLPHIWLDNGSPLHDILGSSFTLLQMPGAATDRGATGFARELAAAFGRLAAPLDLVGAPSAAAEAASGGHRRILVGPDRHVAWRSGDSWPDATALAALVTGNLREPGDVTGKHGVADERRRVDQRMRDDHRVGPPPAQEQRAEDDPHNGAAEEPAQPPAHAI